MADEQKEEPVGCGVLLLQTLGALLQLVWALLQLALLPCWAIGYYCSWALTGRDRLAARGFAQILQANFGQHVPEPLPPAGELRQRVLEHLPNPSVVGDRDVYAAEGWIICCTRCRTIAGLLVELMVLSGAAAVVWRFGLPWAEARLAAAPVWGWVSVGLALLGVVAASGWLGLGVARLVLDYGPLSWFQNHCNRQIWKALGADPEAPGDPPGE
jgi:hypothetical protein